jgi:hypothetical protein
MSVQYPTQYTLKRSVESHYGFGSVRTATHVVSLRESGPISRCLIACDRRTARIKQHCVKNGGFRFAERIELHGGAQFRQGVIHSMDPIVFPEDGPDQDLLATLFNVVNPRRDAVQVPKHNRRQVAT